MVQRAGLSIRQEPKPAVFIDRDGTVNKERSTYVRSVDELEIFADAALALKPLAERTIPLIMVSNQAGLGKGLFTDEALQAIEDAIQSELQKEGVSLTAAYYCRHTAEMNCACRKPKGGLILQAAQDLGLDLSVSFMVGDNARDMAAGRAAGVKTVFVPTGLHPEVERAKLGDITDYQASDLADAVRWILQQLDLMLSSMA